MEDQKSRNWQENNLPEPAPVANDNDFEKMKKKLNINHFLPIDL